MLIDIFLCGITAFLLLCIVLRIINELSWQPSCLKRFYCWIGWHSPRRKWEMTVFDGCNQHAVCPWCDYEGMIDSNGDLF